MPPVPFDVFLKQLSKRKNKNKIKTRSSHKVAVPPFAASSPKFSSPPVASSLSKPSSIPSKSPSSPEKRAQLEINSDSSSSPIQPAKRRRQKSPLSELSDSDATNSSKSSEGRAETPFDGFSEPSAPASENEGAEDKGAEDEGAVIGPVAKKQARLAKKESGVMGFARISDEVVVKMEPGTEPKVVGDWENFARAASRFHAIQGDCLGAFQVGPGGLAKMMDDWVKEMKKMLKTPIDADTEYVPPTTRKRSRVKVGLSP